MDRGESIEVRNGIIYVDINDEGGYPRASFRFDPIRGAPKLKAGQLEDMVRDALPPQYERHMTIGSANPNTVEVEVHTPLENAAIPFDDVMITHVGNVLRQELFRTRHNIPMSDQGIPGDLACHTAINGNNVELHVSAMGESKKLSMAEAVEQAIAPKDIEKMALALLARIFPDVQGINAIKSLPGTIQREGVKGDITNNWVFRDDLKMGMAPPGITVTLHAKSAAEAKKLLGKLENELDALKQQRIEVTGGHAQKLEKPKPVDVENLIKKLHDAIRRIPNATNDPELFDRIGDTIAEILRKEFPPPGKGGGKSRPG